METHRAERADAAAQTLVATDLPGDEQGTANKHKKRKQLTNRNLVDEIEN